MAAVVFYRQGLIGGGATDLDEKDGASLNDGDAAFVFTGTQLYTYRLDDSSGAAESSPDVIQPDTNAGNKRWILQGINGDGFYQSTQIFTASGTYTKPAGLVRAEVIVIGSGGGGGGVNNNSANGAGGRGGGGMAMELIEAASIGATETVTINNAGTGGSAGGGNGTAGGSVSFGALLSATGGAAGDGSSGTANTGNSAAGGVGSGGDLNISGGIGNGGDKDSGGAGGSTYFGGGGKGGDPGTVGSTGGNYGSGGGGGGKHSGTAPAGGDGAKGVVLVREYY